MPLSDIAIRNAKPASGIVKLSDGGGLQVWIMPNGSKLWRLAYRFDGKQLLMAVGSYPAITLAAARDKREAAKASRALSRAARAAFRLTAGYTPMDSTRCLAAKR